MNNLTVDDWFELFADAPGLKERGWSYAGENIRDQQGFCPLCAWAEEKGYLGRRYHTAHHMALDQVFGGNFIDYDAADAIAAAADFPSEEFDHIRARLIAYLGVTK